MKKECQVNNKNESLVNVIHSLFVQIFKLEKEVSIDLKNSFFAKPTIKLEEEKEEKKINKKKKKKKKKKKRKKKIQKKSKIKKKLKNLKKKLLL